MPLPLARTPTTLETAPQTPRSWLGTAVKDQEADFGALYAAEFTAGSRTVFLILHDRTRPETVGTPANRVVSCWSLTSQPILDK